MSKCELNFPHKGNPESLLAQAREAIEGNGGEMTGDNRSGQFSISKMGFSVSGRYEVNGGEFRILIDNKPVFISCNQIEEMIGSKIA